MTVLKLAFSLAVITLSGWIYVNRQFVIDQLVVWRNPPTAELSQLSERSALSSKGEFLFYASVPEVLKRGPFNEACQSVATEETAVLGCYAAGRIYLFDIDNEKLDGIKEVTAAHEMLHAAYERLSQAERARVDALLKKQSLGADKERLEKLLESYAKTEPGQQMNELHSILATEVSELNPELETYYAQYFENRSSVVNLAKNYQQVFEDLKKQQDTLVSQLNSLADAVDAKTQEYKTLSQQLNADITSFNARASSGSMSREVFDQQRAQLVARQSELSTLYDEIQQLIEDYDQKKKSLEAVNLESTSLNRSINSALPDVKEID